MSKAINPVTKIESEVIDELIKNYEEPEDLLS